jgi:hypothetical protein
LALSLKYLYFNPLIVCLRLGIIALIDSIFSSLKRYSSSCSNLLIMVQLWYLMVKPSTPLNIENAILIVQRPPSKEIPFSWIFQLRNRWYLWFVIFFQATLQICDVCPQPVLACHNNPDELNYGIWCTDELIILQLHLEILSWWADH